MLSLQLHTVRAEQHGSTAPRLFFRPPLFRSRLTAPPHARTTGTERSRWARASGAKHAPRTGPPEHTHPGPPPKLSTTQPMEARAV